jgi:hypothetical protein
MTTKRAPLLGSPNYAGTRDDRIADATARLRRGEEFDARTRRDLAGERHARRVASLRNLLAESAQEQSRAATDLGSAVQEPRS